jgi:N-carbamoylputrescine amidase
MRISLIQMNSKEADRDYNVDKACKLVEETIPCRPDLIVLPEFFNNEYFPQYRDYKYIHYAEKDDGYTLSRMKELSRKHSVNMIATIYEEERPGLYYDTAMVINAEGRITGKYRKVHPAGIKSLEKIYFRGGSRFYVFPINGWKVGIIICYDWRFPESMRCLALLGAELVIIPFAASTIDMWSKALPTRAWENSLYVAACNKVGKEGDWNFPGGSVIIDPEGNIMKSAGNGEETITADLDLSLVYQARIKSPVFRDRRPEVYKILSAFEDEISQVGEGLPSSSLTSV